MSLIEMIAKRNQLEGQISALEEQIRPAILPLKAELDEIQAAIDSLVASEAKTFFHSIGKDFGTADFQIDGIAIKAVIDKKIKWDQAKLQEIRGKILSSRDDASQYIEEKLHVPERKYNSWPEFIKDVFQPARTVTPSEPKYEMQIDEIPF